jgi:hypothetical protein
VPVVSRIWPIGALRVPKYAPRVPMASSRATVRPITRYPSRPPIASRMAGALPPLIRMAMVSTATRQVIIAVRSV